GGTDRRGGAGDGRRRFARGGLSDGCDGGRRGVRGLRLAHRRTRAGGPRRTHVHASAGGYRAQVAGGRRRARPGDGWRRPACGIRAGWGAGGPPGLHDWLALVASMIRDLLRAAGESPSEYVTHHLKHWQISIGDGAFWTVNVDSLLVSVLVGVLTMGTFWLMARRATSGVPSKFQAFIEMAVGFIDTQVKDVFHGNRSFVAPVALTIFMWVFMMNALKMVPVDFFPALTSALGLEYFRVVPTTDLNITSAIALAVLLLMFVCAICCQGVGGFGKELLAWSLHGCGVMKGVLEPFIVALSFVEYPSKSVSRENRLFGNMYAG